MSERTNTAALTESITLEPGGWLVARRRASDLDHVAGRELLHRAALKLAPPQRFALEERDGTEVWLLTETRLIADELFSAARERLSRSLGMPPSPRGPAPSAEMIETALAEACPNWELREGRWVAPRGGLAPVELSVHEAPGGVRVVGDLARLEGDDDRVPAALGEFLVRAQSNLRFARAELDAAGARLETFVATADLESELSRAISCVAQGCSRLYQEAEALARPELAMVYLSWLAGRPTTGSKRRRRERAAP